MSIQNYCIMNFRNFNIRPLIRRGSYLRIDILKKILSGRFLFQTLYFKTQRWRPFVIRPYIIAIQPQVFINNPRVLIRTNSRISLRTDICFRKSNFIPISLAYIRFPRRSINLRNGDRLYRLIRLIGVLLLEIILWRCWFFRQNKISCRTSYNQYYNYDDNNICKPFVHMIKNFSFLLSPKTWFEPIVFPGSLAVLKSCGEVALNSRGIPRRLRRRNAFGLSSIYCTSTEIASKRGPPRFARRPVCIEFSGQKRIGDFERRKEKFLILNPTKL